MLGKLFMGTDSLVRGPTIPTSIPSAVFETSVYHCRMFLFKYSGTRKLFSKFCLDNIVSGSSANGNFSPIILFLSAYYRVLPSPDDVKGRLDAFAAFSTTIWGGVRSKITSSAAVGHHAHGTSDAFISQPLQFG